MKISEKKREKILSQIIDILYLNFPKPLFTSFVAQEIARDEEFVKSLLIELKSKKLVNEVNKNKDGINYIRRLRWKLTDETYSIYKNRQRE